MINKIKKIIINNTGPLFYSTKSYSQEGEDLMLYRIFEGRKTGFYVDIGCHHPFRFSNSYLFYKLGWRGICVDPLPGTKALFNKWRPEDIAIECGVSAEKGKLNYIMFNEPALNTFDSNMAEERNRIKGYNIINKKDISVNTLSSLLNELLPKDIKDIDFFTIDVEGLDLDVLISNDWKNFKPQVIVAECLKSELNMIAFNDVTIYLNELNYMPYAKTGNSVIYIKKLLISS